MASLAMQQLSQKEQSLFRQVVKFYESKQYKKGIKAADQILRAKPDHGDTQAMKALILNSMGQGDEAFALCKVALKNSMKSHVCWHVYGLLYRSVKNYEEAIKAYKFALKLDPEQSNILRDLALLQMQMRDYTGYLDSRKKMLSQQPQLRQNWTAVAIAHHLLGDYKQAEAILTTYEDTLKTPPPRSDLMHAEAVLYKNTIIAESGDVERALEHLEKVLTTTLDRTAALELRAKYLLDLGRKEEAEKAYRAMLDRNAENRAYYDGLEKALGLDRSDSSAQAKLKELYDSYAAKSERYDAPRRIPLDFLTGDEFRAAADQYLRRMLNKGVPSTFANIKALYSDPEKKKVIEELALRYESVKQSNGSTDAQANGDISSRFEEAALYFLAQHYNYHLSRDLEKAMQYIDKLIERSPKSVDYSQTKARIYKHQGNTKKAAEVINHARELDLKDRYINTKCAKYQLRNDDNELALSTMSKFTRNEAVGGPLGDLHDMQCLWYLLEDGESYLRQEKLGLALKRFTSVADIFDIWQDDQFDFHSFSLRKGQIRAYVDMLRWEDSLRQHPFFSRAAISAVKIYQMLADNPDMAGPAKPDLEGMDATERKKAIKKAKKEQEKREKEEADRKAAAAKKATPTADGEAKKVDTDPTGVKLLETKEPLEACLRFLNPLLEFSPKNIEAQNAGFEIHLRRNKPFLALKCLNAAKAIDAENPKLHEQAVCFRQYLDGGNTGLADILLKGVKDSFTIIPADADLKSYNKEWQQKHAESIPHQQAALSVQYLLDNSARAQSEDGLKNILEKPTITVDDAVTGLEYLKQWKSDAGVQRAYKDTAAQKWPGATVFQRE